eukprot:gene12569-16857_t
MIPSSTGQYINVNSNVGKSGVELSTLPSNPKDLMKILKAKKKKTELNGNNSNQIVFLNKKIERENNLEMQLMAMEDYIFTPEGVIRMNRYAEKLKMETEDENSLQIELKYRIEIKEKLFRIQVRKEAEERKQQELIEKELKKKAAEERRAQVVEKIRKKKEDEERRAAEAEAYRLQMIEEKQRLEQLIIDRLNADRSGMSYEDDLSRLAEQDYREQIEKIKWKEREKLKLIEWEKEQKLKDNIEAQKRKERLAILEEKKAKLAEIRKLQGDNMGSNGQNNTNESLLKAREEAARLNKQLRIQNKAKFVSKQILSGEHKIDDIVDESLSKTTVQLDEEILRRNAINNIQNNDNISSFEMKNDMSSNINSKSSAVGPLLSRQLSRIQGNISSKNLMSHTNNHRPQLSLQLHAPSTHHNISSPPNANSVLSTNNNNNNNNISGHNHSHDRSSRPTSANEPRQRRLSRQNSLDNARLSFSIISENIILTQQFEKSKEEFENYLKTMTSEHELRNILKNLIIEKRACRLEQRQRNSFYEEKLNDNNNGEMFINDIENEKILKMKIFEISFKEELIEARIKELMINADPERPNNSTEIFIREANNVISDHKNNSNDINPTNRNTTLLIMEMTKLSREIQLLEFDPINYCEKLLSLIDELKKLSSIAITYDASQTVNKNTQIVHRARVRSDDYNERNSDTNSIGSNLKVSQSIPNGLNLDNSNDNNNSNNNNSNNYNKGIDDINDPSNASESDNYIENNNDDNEEFESIMKSLPGWDECINTSMATAAHHAAFYGYYEVLDFLSKYFDCFIIDKKGRTPLFFAALQNRVECVACLISIDCRWIDVGDEKGDTPIHAAVIANSVQVLKFLLSCEVNPDTANFAGLTPSHLAKSYEALSILYDAGSEPFCVDSKSRLPLWFACNDGRNDCVSFLCSVTPPEFILWPDDEGETVLHKAAANGHNKCVEIICQWLRNVEDLYVLNSKQYTPAHVAKNASVLQVLYENGANLWITDAKNRMPLFMASFFNRVDCISFLIDIALTKQALEMKQDSSLITSPSLSH